MMPPYGTPPPYAMYAQGTPYQQAPMPPVSLHLLLESMILSCLRMTHIIIIIIATITMSFFLCQGSHPYSPYPMQSPNGTAQTPVS